MGIRTLLFPDGSKKSIEANPRFQYATAVKIGNQWNIFHRHYTIARAEKVAKRLDKIIAPTGGKIIIAKFI